MERSLKALARRNRQSVSEVIRDAIRTHLGQEDGQTLDRRLSYMIGKVASGGGHTAKDAGKQYAKSLLARKRGKRR